MPQARGSARATFYNWKAKYGGLEVSEAKAAADARGRERQTEIQSPSLTTNFNNDLIYGLTFDMNGSGGAIAAGSGFTLRQQDTANGYVTGDQSVGSAPQTDSVTFTDATHGGVSAYSTFAIALVP